MKKKTPVNDQKNDLDHWGVQIRHGNPVIVYKEKPKGGGGKQGKANLCEMFGLIQKVSLEMATDATMKGDAKGAKEAKDNYNRATNDLKDWGCKA